MAPVSCSYFRSRFESWLENSGSENDRPGDLDSHARDCRACAALLEDLGALEAAARDLGSVEPEPPQRIWLSLSAQLEREGLIRAGERVTAEAHRGWLAGIAAWLRGSAWGIPRPVFAAGYVAVIVVLGFSLSGPIHRQVVDYEWREGTNTSDINAHLTLAAQRTVALPVANPVVTASLHDNLAIVDNYIALCEKSVRKDPQNEIARDYLYDAYQQKAYLLAQMNERGD
jgi:hypothetical protein